MTQKTRSTVALKYLKRVALAASFILNAYAHAEPVRLIFAGDIMLDEGPGRLIKSGGDPLAPFDSVLKEADYRIANLECSVAEGGFPHDHKIYTFRAAPQALSVLKDRFDAVSLANNHSGDYGRQGLLETMQNLTDAGISYFGAGINLNEAHKPLWINRKGLKIAVLGYNEYKPRSFEAGPTWPGIAWSEDDHVISDIRAAKAAGADLIIPFMHWGWEKESQPSERQRLLAHKMIDEGASLVVGGHPHVTQGAEMYKGKPIIYSLGNFVFNGFDDSAAKHGWLLRLKVDKSGLLFWDTLIAQMDEDGTPHPLSGLFSVCGRGGSDSLSECLTP